eukprot:scaffold59508_cov51-Phaeocystis_antarctica.AAC.2
MVSFLTLVALPALAAGFEAPVEAAGATVLVTGATGRTGALLYAKLKADCQVAERGRGHSALVLSRSVAAPGSPAPSGPLLHTYSICLHSPLLRPRRTPASARSVRS